MLTQLSLPGTWPVLTFSESPRLSLNIFPSGNLSLRLGALATITFQVHLTSLRGPLTGDM